MTIEMLASTDRIQLQWDNKTAPEVVSISNVPQNERVFMTVMWARSGLEDTVRSANVHGEGKMSLDVPAS